MCAPALPEHGISRGNAVPSMTDNELKNKTVKFSKLTSMGYSVVNSLENMGIK